MYAQFRHLDGPRAGETRVMANDFATIGRHPSSDLGFDAEKDLEVSIRHAAVFKQGGGFMVRDLGSTNGTFLNGKRVRGDRPLEPGDELRFGPNGPRVEFATVATLPAAGRRIEPAPPPPVMANPEIFGPRTGTTERIRVEVRKQTGPWKWIAGVSVVVALAIGGGAVWQTRRLRLEVEQQRDGLLAQVDDLLARLRRTRAGNAGVEAALAEARTEVDRLRAVIAGDQLSPARLDTLQRTLEERAARHEVVLAAAALDPTAASKPSGPAVAVLVGEFQTGRLISGTAFGVRTAGDTIWLATAGHLVRDSTGTAALRLAVIFNGSGQAFRAAVAGIDEQADAALLVAVIRGGGPAVTGLADTVSTGAPVAILGFPLGLDSLPDWRKTGAIATGTVGTVTGVGPDRLTVDGYGTHGSSGSPIFSADGRVVGLVSGRSTGSDGMLVAVPAPAIRRLLGR